MRTRHSLLLLLLLIAGWGCKPKQVATEPAKTTEPTAPMVIEPACSPVLRGTAAYKDHFSSLTNQLNGDCLLLKYQYSGGCKPHDVEVYWSGTWTETIPPGTKLWVSHNANEDRCEAVKAGTKALDLKPLRYEGVGQVVIDLISPDGKLQRVNYVYSTK